VKIYNAGVDLLKMNKGAYELNNDAVLTNYDSIAENFLAHIKRADSWNNLYERPYVLAQFSSFQDKTVLDIGCASGFYTEHALKNGAYVTAVDISKKMIDRLASRVNSPRLRLFCADISQPMPFLESASLDYVICSLVIDYIKDWEPLLAELYRVMKKGGRLVISTHHPFAIYLHFQQRSYFEFKFVEDTWGLRTGHLFKTHFYIRPLSETLRPIIQSRFKIVSIDEPLPTEKCKKVSPELYRRLSERPAFLFIVLEK
jgi:SAM-dependent methyltransferase